MSDPRLASIPPHAPIRVPELHRLWRQRAFDLGLDDAGESEVIAAAFSVTGRDWGHFSRAEASAILDRLEAHARLRRGRWQVTQLPDGRPAIAPDPDGRADNRAAAWSLFADSATTWRIAALLDALDELAAQGVPSQTAHRRLAVASRSVRRWRGQSRSQMAASTPKTGQKMAA